MISNFKKTRSVKILYKITTTKAIAAVCYQMKSIVVISPNRGALSKKTTQTFIKATAVELQGKESDP